MKLHAFNLGTFKLDGGAMFGVVPKSIWQRTNPADANNMCTWALRLMLIETGDRRILVDTGMGTKQSEKFFGYYYLEGEHNIDSELATLGFKREDISDVFLTHLHFDHVGGATEIIKSGSIAPTFPNAKYWTNKRHWQWATKPNAREKASFLKENLQPLEESGKLHFFDLPEQDQVFETGLGFKALLVSGHTDAQMLPMVEHNGKTIVYVADLLPSVGHIPLPYVMGYDTRPLITVKEKKAFLEKAADKGYYLVLEHDSVNEICTVKHTEKGVRLNKTYKASDIF